MDFTCIVLFLALYYIKPQEWTSVFATIRFVQLVMFASLLTLFFRERSLKPRGFFRTPHDWAVYLFLLCMVISSPTPLDTLKDEVFSKLIFYVVTVQTLYSLARVNKFLGWWTVFLVITAFLAIAGEYFWDPLGSWDKTHSNSLKGRLILNISTVNNPNALAHALAPALAMLYYFTIWKRSVFLKALGIGGLALVTFTIYLTLSKGGFLATGATIMTMLTFGRPKSMQIVIASVLVMLASVIAYQLPRMTELKSTKGDGAIQGRVASFTHGYHYYQSNILGVGYGQFIKRQLSEYKLHKAPHSVYNNIGSELGKPGMFLFLLIMWSNFKTLVFMKSQSVEQERARRVLFTLVLSYAISGWMVDFAYRPSFFLFTAAIAVFHRLYCIKQEEVVETDEPIHTWRTRPVENLVALPSPVMQLAALPATPSPSYMELMQVRNPTGFQQSASEETSIETEKKTHEGFSFKDLAITLVALKAVEMVWVYSINHF